MKILIVETSAADCSVAVASDGKSVWELSSGSSVATASSNSEHSRLLAPYIESAIEACGVPDAVAVSYGPGSYTGLRIGLSTAKGLCFGADIPLILIDSLRGLVSSAIKVLERSKEQTKERSKEQDKEQGGYLLCPMIDARRMEVYTAFYNEQGEQLTDIAPLIVDGESFKECAKELYVFGSGAAKSVEQLLSNALEVRLVEGVTLSAADFSEVACEMYSAGKFADLAYAEPLYLKEWQSTSVPKKSLPTKR